MKLPASLAAILAAATQNWAYLLTVAVILVEVGLSVRFLPGYLADIGSQRAKLTSVSAVIATLSSTKATLSQTNPQTIKEDLDRVTTALPNEKKVSGLVSGLTTLASTSGVIVSTLEFSPGQISSGSASTTPKLTTIKTLPDNVSAIPTSLSIVSGLSSLGSLLGSLNSISQLVGVRAVSVSTSSNNQTGAQFSVLVYYQPVSDKPVDFENVQAITPEEETVIRSLSPRDVLTLPGQK